jgi:TolB-like protein/lipoprotein NlpI
MRYQTARDLLIDLKNLRRTLDIQGELERSVIPNRAEVTAAGNENATQVHEVGETLDAGKEAKTNAATSVSSLEYAVTRAKSHKLATAAVGIILLSIISAVAYFGYLAKSGSKKIESIAVMPFVNESGNADVEYLSDGMTETLIKNLSQVPNLSVKARSTVFYYKGKEISPKKIGEELNVQAVLLGRVAGRGDELKLSLELVNTQTQDVIWSEQYDRKQSDLISLQSEIAKDVSSKLKLKLSGADEAKVTKTSTASPEAYQAYLKGRYYWNRRTAENLKKAIEQFKAATDLDPNYALAFAGLADCYVVLHEYAGTPTSETVPQAKTYAERALSLDGQLAEPHVALGAINDQLWQWAEAEKEFKTAIELNPNYPTAYHWYSMLLKNLGRYDEAAAMIRRAQELDPLSGVIGVNVSRMYLELQNNPAKSVEACLKVIELDPNFAPAHEYLGLSYLKQGRRTEAVAALEKAAELSNRAGNVLSNLGYAYAATGKRTEAITVIKEMEDKYARKEANAQFIAAVYAGLGEKDKAFEWLEKDFQTRNGKLAQIGWTFSLQPLGDDPRFKGLLKRMNLPE